MMELPTNLEERDSRESSLTGAVVRGYFVYTGEPPAGAAATFDDWADYAAFASQPIFTLTRLRVDSSVREIPEEAFCNYTSLVRVQFSDTLSRIGKRAFENCESLKYVQFVSNASSFEETLSNSDLEEGLIVFPERTNLQIDDHAFAWCDGLRKVIVSSVSTKLGVGVFSYCQGLLSAELPEELQVIQQCLFSYCNSLATVKIPSSVINICQGAFIQCQGLTHVDLPHGLLEIGESSFEGCASIETLHIPSTVSAIGKCAFFQCESLSHIRVPPGVEIIVPSAFLGCSSLISVELPEGILIGNIEEEGLVEGPDRNPYLVNLAIPTLPEDDEVTSGLLYTNSRLGSVVDNEGDLHHKLKHRFDNSPVNKLCYYQSYNASEDAMVNLHSLMGDDPLAATTQVDEFGMTPLHVLSLSQTPNLDMLLTAMKGGPLDHIIRCRDSFGYTPIDYLCLNRLMPNCTEVIRKLVQTRFDHLWGLDRSWKSDMLQAIDAALAVHWSFRRREVVAVCLKLANYERKEIFSIVELCLWKIKTDEANCKEKNADRARFRINSGATVVIPHVLSFLDATGMKDYVVSSPDELVGTHPSAPDEEEGSTPYSLYDFLARQHFLTNWRRLQNHD